MSGRHVALIGCMGAGKTTVGRLLAARLGLPFTDLDAEIEAKEGPIPRIFAERGEAAFRALESAALDKALDAPPGVIACGGGTPCFGDAMERLLARATVVFLDAPPAILAARVGADPKRPLSGAGAGDLCARRRPVYLRAPLQLRADAPPEALADRIAGALEDRCPP